MKISKQFYKPILVILLAVAVIAVVAVRSFAFTGPTQNSGVGGGAIGVGTGGNISIGTPTPLGNTMALIVGSSSDSSYYALKILNAAQNPLAIFRNDGAVSIGTTTLAANTLTLGGNITVAGGLASTINAINVSAGTFGSGTGGGNFSFPGNVGIGTASPSTTLDVAQNGATRLGYSYLSSGGLGYSWLGSNAWYNGASWVIPDASRTSNLLGFNDNLTYFYRTTATGTSNWLLSMNIDANGKVGIGAGGLSVASTVQSTAGGFKFPDGTTQVTAAGAGATPHIQTFTANGTWTWPSGVSEVWVTACGGGGGGGSSWNAVAGPGGGGAACIIHYPVAVSGNVSVTVGAAGAASVVGGFGGKGGTSSFGAFASALGGSGGGGPNDYAGGGVTGGMSGGGVTSNGPAPVNGIGDGYGSSGAPGGGGSSVTGNNGGSDGVHIGGRGGCPDPEVACTYYSYGAGGGASSLGNGGNGGFSSSAGFAPSSGYGGGGGGGAIGPGGATGFTGGAGAPGVVIVEWMQ